MRGRAYNRTKSLTKAKRKRNLCRKFYGFEYYDNLHEYSKNKIHCSCFMCRMKTNEHKMKWSSGGRMKKNWKHSDVQKLVKMDKDMQDYISNLNYDYSSMSELTDILAAEEDIYAVDDSDE